jgi:hypothetical protein
MKQAYLILVLCLCCSSLFMAFGCGAKTGLNEGIIGACPSGQALSNTSGCVDVLVGQVDGADILYYLKNGQKVYIGVFGDFTVDAQGNKTYLK